MTERHTFTGVLPYVEQGDEIYVEEFVHDDGSRHMCFAIREKPWVMWGPPNPLEQTS